MITVVLNGGLGNILFQYAVGRRLALRLNTSLRLDTGKFMHKRDLFGSWISQLLGHFDLAATVHKPYARRVFLGKNSLRPDASKKTYVETVWGFNPEVLDLGDGAVLHGFFQSEHYISPIADTIKADLRLKKLSNNGMRDRLENRIRESNSVALHIRRGDYLTTDLLHVCNLEYYTKAVSHMRRLVNDPTFFIFSDDMAWCRDQIKLPDCVYVELGGARKQPIDDFHLLGCCRHAIISNSTYSWWAAWLNSRSDSVVLTPYRWFTDPVMNTEAMRNLVPQGWRRIEF